MSASRFSARRVPRTGVVVPAFNAACTLPAVLQRLNSCSIPVAGIWIVDDGSLDATATLVARLLQREPRLFLLRHPENRGYGAALKTGIAAARAAGVDELVCLHADGQYAPEEMHGLITALRQRRLDLLQGSRLAAGTARSGGMPLYKYVAGRMLTAIENRAFDLELSDYHSGYLIYGRRALALPVAELSDSFAFDLEVIAAARAAGLEIGEEPIQTHYGDEVSHLWSIPYGLQVLGVVSRFRRGYYHQREREGAPAEGGCS